MRLSEARLLLSRYKKNRHKGTAVPAGGALPAVDLKASPGAPSVAAEDGDGVSAEKAASTAGGEAAEKAAAAALRLEQGLMRRVEKAVMALTEVGDVKFAYRPFVSKSLEPFSLCLPNFVASCVAVPMQGRFKCGRGVSELSSRHKWRLTNVRL